VGAPVAVVVVVVLVLQAEEGCMGIGDRCAERPGESGRRSVEGEVERSGQ